METPSCVILIDDDQINNLYCNIIISETASDLEVITFDMPEKGFEFIAENYLKAIKPTVLFLDLNMPTWSGWVFLDNFGKLDPNITNQIKIYILSSSIDPADHRRARENKYVFGYIEKPLTKLNVLSTLKSPSFIKDPDD